jgi:hypothetical protein
LPDASLRIFRIAGRLPAFALEFLKGAVEFQSEPVARPMTCFALLIAALATPAAFSELPLMGSPDL